jgi:hypothetical protein
MRGWRIACVLGIALSLAAVDANAGRKESIKARVNGKRFKGNLKPAILGARDASLDTLTLNGLYQHISPGRGTVKTLTIIALVDLDTAVLPVTVPALSTTYSQATVTGFVPSGFDIWSGEGVSVTIQSFDGTRVTGTFEGTIPPSAGDASAPAVVEKGKFKIDLDDLGLQ